MHEPRLYPRHVAPRLVEALADSPVVLIHGPRQCGKTTLAQQVGQRAGYAPFTFDDAVAVAAAGALAEQMFDAGVRFRRVNRREDPYSIAEDAASEFLRWEDMPWE
jgi:MoxR-like ATPase